LPDEYGFGLAQPLPVSPGEVLVPLVEELDGDGNGQLHDALLVIVQEQAGHDIARHLSWTAHSKYV
jgi:hypothetical protein